MKKFTNNKLDESDYQLIFGGTEIIIEDGDLLVEIITDDGDF